MAAGMINTAVNLDSILPDPVTGIVQVDLLEVLLTDGANAVLQSRVAGHGNVLELGDFRN